MKSTRFCLLCGILTAVLIWLLRGGAPALSAQEKSAPVSFINDVAPILKDYCFACHDPRKGSGKFDMTTFEKLLAGGANGEAVTAGKPAESDLHDLMVTKEERRMPPRKDGLSPVPPAKADTVRRWIAEGAKLDAGIDPKADLVKVMRLRWQPPAPPAAYKYGVPITALAFTPDGRELVAGGNYELTVWNIETGKLAKRIRTRAERAYAVLFGRDGNLIVAGGRPGQEGDIRVYNIAVPGKMDGDVAILDGINDSNAMRKQLFDGDDSVLCLAISPDGNLLAAGGCDRAIRVWNIAGGAAAAKLEQTVDNHADWVFALAFDAKGTRLLTGSRDKTAKIWDLKAKESITTFPDHQATVAGVAWAADGKSAYSAGGDKVLRQWNAVPQGKSLKQLGSHDDEILKVVAHPTLPLLVTAGADKAVKVWNLDSPKASRALLGLTDQVYSAAFSPDGKRLAAGDYNGEVRVWNLDDGRVLKAFNASPGLVR